MSANELLEREARVTELCNRFNKARHQIWDYLNTLETRIA